MICASTPLRSPTNGRFGEPLELAVLAHRGARRRGLAARGLQLASQLAVLGLEVAALA